MPQTLHLAHPPLNIQGISTLQIFPLGFLLSVKSLLDYPDNTTFHIHAYFYCRKKGRLKITTVNICKLKSLKIRRYLHTKVQLRASVRFILPLFCAVDELYNRRVIL